MDISNEHNIRQIIRWFAGSIALIITLIIPSEHLYTGYKYQVDITKNKSHYIAEDISQFVFSSPKTWTFQEHRISSIIENFIDLKNENITLTDSSGDIIYANSLELGNNIITIQESIYDANEVVAQLEVKISYEPLIIETLYSALAALFLGMVIFLTLYILPMKTLTSAFKKLHDAQEALKEEISNKENALQEAHELGQKLHKMAMYDSLTELANRSMYNEKLTHALLLAERQKTSLAVVMIDLNRFKDINDSLGHHAGDILLVEIAKRLKASTRKSDTVARLGGDEFALILHIETHDNATIICNKLSNTIRTPVQLPNQTLEISSSASFGIAFYPEHGTEASQLLQQSDIAMYAAKNNPSNIVIYSKSLEVNTPEKLRLTNLITHAIQNNEMHLAYQPKIDIKTNKVVGVEALARWIHPEDGFISPGLFIPLAEESEFIHPFTDWVIETALEQQCNWKKEGISLDISINISANNLRDENLHHKLKIAMMKWGTTPSEVILEVTESAMIDNPERAINILQDISNQGVRLSIDDFGTGHASLIQLKTFPFNELKIDRSFIKDIIIDNNDAVIVRSAIALSKSLNMKTVAEGIEDERAIDMLNEMGCDLAQGFYLCKPLNNTDLLEWLSTRDE